MRDLSSGDWLVDLGLSHLVSEDLINGLSQIPNYLADRIGPMNVMAPVCLSAAALAFAWLAVQDLAGASVFCVLYGYVATPPPPSPPCPLSNPHPSN